MAKKTGPLPTPDEVVYVRPNPDNSRKACANCITWSLDKRCMVHAADKKIEAEDICSYHVFGKPTPKRRLVEDLHPLLPQESGLIRVAGGTSCDICEYYANPKGDKGTCQVVQTEAGQLATVHAKGCCGRWERDEKSKELRKKASARFAV